MKVLLLQDCSILAQKATVEIKDRFFDKADFTLDDVYNCLTHFNKIEKDAQNLFMSRL